MEGTNASSSPRRLVRRRSSLFARGESMVWMTGAALVLCIAMIVGLLGFIVVRGGRTFWPRPLELVTLRDGGHLLGELMRTQTYQPADRPGPSERYLWHTGNRSPEQREGYVEVSDFKIASQRVPSWGLTIERVEWGRFYGELAGFVRHGKLLTRDPAEAWALYERHHQGEASAEDDALRLETPKGEENVRLRDIVRAYPANRLGFFGKLGIYASRWWEFLSAEPREANTEGGVWPAILGTIVLTMLMTLLVVPFGVLGALYLREYAKQGVLVSLVRIAVNNLAGVPSIVFGIFGLGFFCYTIGAGIDHAFFADQLPNPTFGKGTILWASLTLALLTLPVVVVATEEALAAVPGSLREGSYACGASKWQTIRRIVLPRAMPGVMTGMILAIARGAGEVAPIMLVGAAKMAPDLPVDGSFPFVHPGRGFMHLGFHIYDVGFQSPDANAAVPMVFTTTLLLIGIVVVLNIVAIRLRGRLRRAYVEGG